MERLTQTNLRRLSQFLVELYALRDHRAFVQHLLAVFPDLFHSDVTSYNHYDIHGPARTVAEWTPLEAISSDDIPVFAHLLHQNPLARYMQDTQDGVPRKISDFIGQRDFRRLGIYHEFYRKVGIAYQMGCTLAAAPDLVICIALNRGRRDFSEQDRSLLTLLQPHIAQAFQNTEAVSKMHATIATLQQIADETDRGVLEINRQGKIIWGTPKAFQWLQAYWPHSRRSDLLPELLASWVQHQADALNKTTCVSDPLVPLVVRRESYTLSVRRVQDGERQLLLMQEQVDGVPPEKLEPLGLGRREAEVLAWVAQGKTNEEIGTVLSISPRTVKKHLERIFSKLGVETRTAAAARALDLLRHSSGR